MTEPYTPDYPKVLPHRKEVKTYADGSTKKPYTPWGYGRRYHVEDQDPFSGEWTFQSGHRFLWYAKRKARRAERGIWSDEHRLVDTGYWGWPDRWRAWWSGLCDSMLSSDSYE